MLFLRYLRAAAKCNNRTVRRSPRTKGDRSRINIPQRTSWSGLTFYVHTLSFLVFSRIDVLELSVKPYLSTCGLFSDADVGCISNTSGVVSGTAVNGTCSSLGTGTAQ